MSSILQDLFRELHGVGRASGPSQSKCAPDNYLDYLADMVGKLEEFVEMLSRDSRHVNDTEIGLYVTWLRRRIPVLQNLETSVVIELIRKGRHLAADKGDAIIHQGNQIEAGDKLRFFIVLQGSVSMYLNPFIATGRSSRSTSKSFEHVLLAFTPSLNKAHPKSAASKKTVSSKKSRTNPDIPEDDVISDAESEVSIDMDKEDDIIDAVSKVNEQPGEGKQETPASQKTADSRSKSMPQKEKSRVKLGRFVVKYEKGKYFGDDGILDENRMFTVSVVANDRSDFLIIDEDFFNKHIKDFHEKEEELLSNFIDDHPFFRKLNPQAKVVLQISLKTVNLEKDSYIVQQGDPVNKLIFLSSGSAEVTVSPQKHRMQYPELWPFETSDDVYYNEFDWLKESRKKMHEEKYNFHGEVSLKAFKKSNQASKKTCICVVDRKEVIGITEVMMDLHTHAQSVKCVEDCEVYTLALKIFRKVVKRRSPETMSLIRAYVEDRLRFRIRSLGVGKVPLFTCLANKISGHLRESNIPADQTSTTNQRLREREEELLQFVDWFRQDKAPLIARDDPETLQYKEEIKDKARERQLFRQNSQVEQKFFRSGCLVAMKTNRAPMSMRQLKDPVNGLMFRLRMEGTFVKDENELEDLIRNCPFTPVPVETDIRTQTNTVLEEELHSFRVRRRSRKLINNFTRMLEMSNVHQISEEHRIMSSALFSNDIASEFRTVCYQQTGSDVGSLWGRLERYDRAITKATARSYASSSYRTIQFERKGATPKTLDMRIQDFFLKYGGDPKDIKTIPALKKYDADIVPEELQPLPGGKVFITKTPCITCNNKVQLKNHLHVRSQMLNNHTKDGYNRYG